MLIHSPHPKVLGCMGGNGELGEAEQVSASQARPCQMFCAKTQALSVTWELLIEMEPTHHHFLLQLLKLAVGRAQTWQPHSHGMLLPHHLSVPSPHIPKCDPSGKQSVPWVQVCTYPLTPMLPRPPKSRGN